MVGWVSPRADCTGLRQIEQTAIPGSNHLRAFPWWFGFTPTNLPRVAAIVASSMIGSHAPGEHSARSMLAMSNLPVSCDGASSAAYWGFIRHLRTVVLSQRAPE